MPRKLPYLIAIIALPLLVLIVWCFVGLISTNTDSKLVEEIGAPEFKISKLNNLDYLDIDLHCTTYTLAYHDDIENKDHDGSLALSLILTQKEDYKADKYSNVKATVVANNKWAKYTTTKKEMSLSFSTSNYNASNSTTITLAYTSTNGWGINSKVGNPDIYLYLTFDRIDKDGTKHEGEYFIYKYSFNDYFTSESKYNKAN